MSEGVTERTVKTINLRGPVEDIPGLTVYIATNFLPIAGGTMIGDIDMDGNAISRALQITLYDETALDEKTLLADNSLLIFQGQALATQAYSSNASNLSSGTIPFARLPVGTTSVTVAAGNHTHTASQITDFSEAVDDEVATLLQAGTDVTVTYNDVANTLTVGLGSNVPRLNAANTFSASQTVGGAAAANLDLRNASNIIYAQFNGTNRSFYAGGDAFAVLVDGTARLYNGGVLAWNNAIQASSGTIDASIRRNATGPTLETRAAGGLKVCNADGSAVAALTCGAITCGSVGSSVNTFLLDTNTGALRLWTDVWLSRASTGVAQVGTASNNALGSLNLANLTASGYIDASSIRCDGSQVFDTTTHLSRTALDVGRAGGFNVVVIGGVFGNAQTLIPVGGLTSAFPALRRTNAEFDLRLADDSAFTSLNLLNLTASGYIDAALRPFTVAGLPLASASDGKEYRVTDSSLAMTSANYGSTPSGGGSNKVRLFSNGTAWLLA